MNSRNGDPASHALDAFAVAKGVADEAWAKAVGTEGPITLQDMQARAIILGLEATSLLLRDLLSEQVVPEIADGENSGHASKFLSAREVAIELHVSLASIRRWSDDGLIPSYRLPGGMRRFKAEDLQTFIDNSRS